MASIDAAVLRGAIPATLVVGAIGTGIGAAVSGWNGALGGIVGTVIVVIFFSIGQGALGYVLRNNPQIATSVALAIYLVKIAVLFVLLLVLQGTTAFDTRVFAGTIVACTLAWTAAEVWVFARTKALTIEPGSGPGA